MSCSDLVLDKPFRITRGKKVPMSDGTLLATDLYMPPGEGPFPVLLERTPYDRTQSVMVSIGAPEYFAMHGYVVAVQDCRGRFDSQGDFYPFRDEGWGKNRDGYDTVEWLAKQPWCKGMVGTIGGSYSGMNQMLLAPTRPPHLKAMFPRMTASRLDHQWVWRGNIFELFIFQWAVRQGIAGLEQRRRWIDKFSLEQPVSLFESFPGAFDDYLSDPFQFLKDYYSNKPENDYWNQWNIESRFHEIGTPMYHLGSWYDIFLGGTLRNYVGIRQKARSEHARGNQKLLIGPWLHGAWLDSFQNGQIAGEVDFGREARLDYNALMLRWFDFHLKNVATGIDEEPPVRIFVMGKNHWRDEEDWPPPPIRYEPLYLSPGHLDRVPPSEESSYSEIHHNPTEPLPSIGGNTLYYSTSIPAGDVPSLVHYCANGGCRDQRSVEERSIVFTSEPLESDLEITGPVQAVLYIASEAESTDLHVRLCDVFPDERSMLVCDGCLRVSAKLADQFGVTLARGEISKVTVDLWATSRVFFSGHRLRVSISSSSFPRYEVNPVPGTYRIFHNRHHPSHLIVPIYPSEG